MNLCARERNDAEIRVYHAARERDRTHSATSTEAFILQQAATERKRASWPPRKVLSSLAALLPESRVQVEVSRVALEVSERTLG